MSRRIVAVAAVVALGAAPDARGDRYVETWLGTWSGTATWKACTVEGAATVDVKVAWHDGMLWVDGTEVYDGLGEVAPEVRDGDVLAFETDDLSVELRPPKAAKKRSKKKPTALLTFTTAAQCTMTARLTRQSSTGIAACDGLDALAEVAASCDVAFDPPTETLTAKVCTASADDLRDHLVASGCIPPDHDPADVAACREVWQLAQRIMRCDRAPVEFKQSTLEHVADLRHALWTLSDDVAADHCTESAKMLRDNADVLHCP